MKAKDKTKLVMLAVMLVALLYLIACEAHTRSEYRALLTDPNVSISEKQALWQQQAKDFPYAEDVR